MAFPWLILPTYNEAQNLDALIERAVAELAACSPDGFRILIVDDGSPDGTGRIADAAAARHDGFVEVLHRERPEGLGPAYLAAFRVALDAGATHVLQMDADGSHDPRDIPRLLGAMDEHDVALGSRYVSGGDIPDWGLLRRTVSKAGSLYARRLLGLPFRDLTGGFKCLRRRVLEDIELATVRSRGYAFQVEVTQRAYRLGFSVTEIPITFLDRTLGSSKMSSRIALEAAWLVPRMRHWRKTSVSVSMPAPRARGVPARELAPDPVGHADGRDG